MKSLFRILTALTLTACLLLSACSAKDIPTKAETAGPETTAAASGEQQTKAEPPGSKTAAPTGEQPEQTTEQPAETTEAAPQNEPGPTLWGKTISGEQVKIPEKAYSGGAERCSAIAPDGVNFLMSGGASPYLYNIETKVMTLLVPADETTKEYLREILALRNGLAVKADAEQMEKIRARLAAMDGRALIQELCTDKGRIQALRQYSTLVSPGENYLLMADLGYTATLLIDCSSGRCYCNFEGLGNPASVHNGKLLCYVRGVPELHVLDLASGEVETLEVEGLSIFPKGARLMAASFLPDGSICAVVGDKGADSREGTPSALVIGRPGSSQVESYSLGSIALMREPDVIMNVGTDYIVVLNRPSLTANAPYLIDRVTGEVRRMISGYDKKVELISLNEYADRYPEKTDSSVGLYPLDSLADGETMLLQNLSDGGNLLLFHLPDGQSKQLISGMAAFPYVVYFSGNHYDRFMDSGHPEEKSYYQLTVR